MFSTKLFKIPEARRRPSGEAIPEKQMQEEKRLAAIQMLAEGVTWKQIAFRLKLSDHEIAAYAKGHLSVEEYFESNARKKMVELVTAICADEPSSKRTLPKESSAMESLFTHNVLGANLRRTRQDRGMTQGALGAMVGKRATFISQIENRIVVPYPYMHKKIAAALGVEQHLLLLEGEAEELRRLRRFG